jgi:carbonic anhydrase
MFCISASGECIASFSGIDIMIMRFFQLVVILSPLSQHCWPSVCRAEIPADGAQAALEAGNRRFLDGKAVAHTWQREKVAKTGAEGQSPSIGVLTCADSRVPVEMIFDMGVGDLFVCRNAGGFDTPEVNATFEYGVAALGVHTVLVLGHTQCGAVIATLDGKPLPGNMSRLTDALRPGIGSIRRNLSKDATVNAAVQAVVRFQMRALIESSDLLAEAHKQDKLRIIGGVYDVDTGRVEFLDEERQTTTP